MCLRISSGEVNTRCVGCDLGRSTSVPIITVIFLTLRSWLAAVIFYNSPGFNVMREEAEGKQTLTPESDVQELWPITYVRVHGKSVMDNMDI